MGLTYDGIFIPTIQDEFWKCVVSPFDMADPTRWCWTHELQNRAISFKTTESPGSRRVGVADSAVLVVIGFRVVISLNKLVLSVLELFSCAATIGGRWYVH